MQIKSESSTTIQRQLSGISLEDNNTLPSLQDIFEELDAAKLEELAESLLADIQNDLEASNSEGNTIDAQDSSETEQLLGRMVGSPTEFMESTSTNLCMNKEQNDHDYIRPPLADKESRTNLKQKLEDTTTLNCNISETIYGKYDEQTNSITILMDEDSTEEEIVREELICEDQNDVEILETNNEIDYDPVKEFLCLPSKIDSVAKSPYSISDYGYSSIGSPHSEGGDPLKFESDIWNESFSELFPLLI